MDEWQDDTEIRLTDEGARKIIEMYARVKEGATVEEIEEEFGLEPESEGEPHLEFRMHMALANLTGLMDIYDGIEYTFNVMDGIEDGES